MRQKPASLQASAISHQPCVEYTKFTGESGKVFYTVLFSAESRPLPAANFSTETQKSPA